MKKLKWKLNKLLTEISIDQIAYHPTKLFVDQKLSPYLAQPLVPHLTKPRIRPTHTKGQSSSARRFRSTKISVKPISTYPVDCRNRLEGRPFGPLGFFLSADDVTAVAEHVRQDDVAASFELLHDRVVHRILVLLKPPGHVVSHSTWCQHKDVKFL